MLRTAHRLCPICAHSEMQVLCAQRFVLPEGHPLSDGYDVVCCEKCGFVYADTTVSQEAYDRFYSQHSKYEDQRTSTGSGDSPWDRSRLEGTAQQIAQFLKDKRGRILDVGCANGGLLAALKRKGYDHLVGIDPSPVCVENTRQLGIRAERGSLFDGFPQDAFDLVVLSHTLEHVHDLGRAADWIVGVLGRDRPRWVYVEVPDATRYGDYLYSPFQEFNTEHINHFSSACLENYLRAYGFEVVERGDKLFESGPNTQYPTIYCFAELKLSTKSTAMERDGGLKACICSYIEKSRHLLDRIEERLREALANESQVIVWGTGQLAMKLLVETSLSHARIAAFVDSNPINQGNILRGVPIIAPQAVVGMPDPIVVSTILHQESVAEQAREMRLPNRLILLGE